MKTNIRTFIGLVALGMIGFTNINATAANTQMKDLVTNFRAEKTELITDKAETERPLEVKEWMTEEEFFLAAQTYTSATSDQEIEKYATRQIENSVSKVGTENNLEAVNYINEAESYTSATSDQEIEKYANKLVALENEKESK